MSYRKSQSRKNFDVAIGNILSDLKHLKRTGISASYKNHVELSCIVLTSAQIENYLTDLLGGWLRDLNSNSIRVADVPSELKAYFANSEHSKRTIFHYMMLGDEPEYIKSMITIMNGNQATILNPNLTMPRLPAGELLNAKYPSPKNFQKIFFRVGIRNIFQQIDPLILTNSKMKMQQFNDVRTAIAHSGSSPGMTTDDIIDIIQYMQKIIQKTDRIMHKHIKKHGGLACWRI